MNLNMILLLCDNDVLGWFMPRSKKWQRELKRSP